jgi:exosome complex RNA-binding protein Rrp42 (RNase PH superfamily)
LLVDQKALYTLKNLFYTLQAREIRPDGRNLMDTRPTVINVSSVSTADGSAVVKIGNTVVICGIKAVSNL